MAVYGPDPFAYDLEAALVNAKTAELPKGGPTVQQLYWRTHWPEAPSRDALIRHAELYGPEEVQEVADAYGIELNVSPLDEYRKEKLALEKRYEKSPTLKARRLRHSRSWLPRVKVLLVSELLSGAVTVAAISAEFNVQERTVRGWCTA